MRMRLISGRWYTNFFRKGKKIEISLDAYERETVKAQINLGKILWDLENGMSPGSAHRKIKHLQIKKKLSVRNEQILRKHIYPFFGEYKPRDITQEVIEDYLEHRWGRNDEGELQAVAITFKMELSVLKMLITTVDSKFILPKTDYRKIEKNMLPPLKLQQVKNVGKLVPKKHQAIYWIMAYTAMDISDVVYLKPEHFKDGWIVKKRGKTCVDIRVPICRALADILETVPRPLNPGTCFFRKTDPHAVSKSIIRAFSKAGLKGYGSKYLRRFVASMLLDAGYSMDWVGKALAHAEGSNITQRYTKVYKDTLQEAFNKIDEKVAGDNQL